MEKESHLLFLEASPEGRVVVVEPGRAPLSSSRPDPPVWSRGERMSTAEWVRRATEAILKAAMVREADAELARLWSPVLFVPDSELERLRDRHASSYLSARGEVERRSSSSQEYEALAERASSLVREYASSLLSLVDSCTSNMSSAATSCRTVEKEGKEGKAEAEAAREQLLSALEHASTPSMWKERVREVIEEECEEEARRRADRLDSLLSKAREATPSASADAAPDPSRDFASHPFLSSLVRSQVRQVDLLALERMREGASLLSPFLFRDHHAR